MRECLATSETERAASAEVSSNVKVSTQTVFLALTPVMMSSGPRYAS